MGVDKMKRKAREVEGVEKKVPLVRDSDEPQAKKGKWINKQRLLIFAARGATYRDRHLMEDIRTLLPHSKSESKKGKTPLCGYQTLHVVHQLNSRYSMVTQ